jgi:hypothetical protein
MQDSSSDSYEKRPGFFKLITGSFSQIQIYNRFRKVRTSSAISFILLLIFILSSINALLLTFYINNELYIFARRFESLFPEIRIKNGEVVSDKPISYIIYPTKPGQDHIIIDTTGTTYNLDKYDKAVVLTKNKLITKNHKKIGTVDLSSIKDFTLNKENLLTWKANLWPNLLPLFLIFWFIYKVFASAIEILIFSLIGKYISSTRNLLLPYSEHIKISILTIVPAMIITALISCILLKLEFLSYSSLAIMTIIFNVIYFFYLNFVYNNMEKSHNKEGEILISEKTDL